MMHFPLIIGWLAVKGTLFDAKASNANLLKQTQAAQKSFFDTLTKPQAKK